MSLEERRAERRRRRQMEEESLRNGTMSPEELQADIQERLARRRKEREERMAAIAASVSTVNGEDDLERRRRERREARLKAAGGGDDTDYSSRRSHRRAQEEDTTETPTYNDTSATDTSAADTSAEAAREEQRRREREEEEEEARRQQEREEAEERRRQEQAEARRREEEEDRRREAERLRREREADAEFEALEGKFSETGLDDKEHNEEEILSEDNTHSVILQKGSDVDKINKFERIRQWNEGENSHKGEINSQLVHSGNVEQRNKISDKLNKFENLKDEPSVKERERDKNSNYLPDRKEGLKNRLNKFEKEIQEQSLPATKDVSGKPPKLKESPAGSNRLHEKLHHFETQAQAQKAGSPNTVQTPDSRADRKSNVLDRWKPPQEDSSSLRSPSSNKNTFSKRLSGNTEFIASRFIEKVNESAGKTVTSSNSVLERSHSLHNGARRQSSQSSETPSDCSDRLGYHESEAVSPPKVIDRWQHNVQETSSTQKSGKNSSVVHSRGSSCDNSYAHSRGSSYDASSDTSLGPKSPVAWRQSQLEQEEEARLEQQRLEEERERQEEEARMAAEEEKKKKKGKRKGLGGLSPDKKKKLKQIIMQKAAEEMRKEALAKAEAKEKYINKYLQPLTIDGLGEAELKKLCQQLHDKLAQFEGEVYDWEFKCEKQELEVNELTLKVNDSKGKFVKPVLRKTNKTESKFAKMKKNKVVKEDFRENLKSTGQSKFGLEEEEEQQAE